MRSRADLEPVVVANPNSTNCEMTDQVVESVAQDVRWGRPRVIYTHCADPMKNAEDLATEIGQESLVLNCGGDGLTMSIANALYMNTDLRGSSLMMPLPIGNACDTSRSFYGNNVLRGGRFLDIMSAGEDYGMSCIETTIDDIGRLAVAYTGIHCTAEISATFADQDYRNGRPSITMWPGWLKRLVDDGLADIRDTRTIAEIFSNNQPFEYEDLDIITDTGQPARFASHDIMRLNVPRFAKVGSVAVGVRGGSVTMEFPEGLFTRQIARAAAQTFTIGMRGMPTQPRTIRIVSDNVRLHTDGEITDVLPGQTITTRDVPAAIRVVL